MNAETSQGSGTLKPPKTVRQLSLRARLILVNMLITFVAIAGLGYYVYYRAQQSNAYLTQQLDTSVLQGAENTLKTLNSEQVVTLNNFFATMSKNVNDLGQSASALLPQENVFGSGVYWDAKRSLSRLPNGSWDNSNSEAAALFIPAAVDLTDPLIAEVNTLRQMDFVVPVIQKSNPDIIAIYFGGNSGETLYYPNVDLSNLVPPDFDVTKRPWFVKAAPSTNPGHTAVWVDPYLDAASNGLVITSSVPVFDGKQQFRGVLAMDIQLNKITEIVANIHVGKTGYAFLIDKSKRIIAMPPLAYKDLGLTPELAPLGQVLDVTKIVSASPTDLWGLLDKMSSGGSNLESITIGGVKRFAIYSQLPEMGYSLGIIVPQAELLTGATAARAQIAQSTQSTIYFGLALVLGILILALLASIFTGNRLLLPLRQLTLAAEQIAKGNMQARAVVQGQDEIGSLASTFNMMVTQLRTFITTLEQRVADRTKALATSSEVSRRLSTILNRKELVVEVVNQVRNSFGYYHTQIYFYDEARENLVMAGGTGEAGETLLMRSHKVPRGLGLVGRAADTNQAVLVSDTSQNTEWLPNPLLPDTRSEVAIPISIGEDVLGVLDVQQNITNGLQKEDVDSLQSIANQVAVALQNIRSTENVVKRATELQTVASISTSAANTPDIQKML